MQTRVLTNFNAGNQFVTYTGHAGTTVWGHDAYFNVASLAQVNNGSRTPIMLPMTCLDGFYQDPTFDSLSEALVKKSGGGAVASYAPTGLQVQAGHDFLLEGFYHGVYVNEVDTVGQAVFQAKLNLHNYGAGFYQDLQDTFILLGDPALQLLATPDEEQTYLPLVRN
jgi:hypothetical protein